MESKPVAIMDEEKWGGAFFEVSKLIIGIIQCLLMPYGKKV